MASRRRISWQRWSILSLVAGAMAADASVLDGVPAAILEGDAVGSGFGGAIAVADVNGDGFDDVIAGAEPVGQRSLHVFFGSATGLTTTHASSADQHITSSGPYVGFGRTVASAGDVNGDGYDDVIAGAAYWDGGETDEGAAFLFLGSATGLQGSSPAAAATRLEGDQDGAGFGYTVGGAGDVNDDGYDDVVVFALTYDFGGEVPGAAFVFHGGPGGIASGGATAAATMLSTGPSNCDVSCVVAGDHARGAGDVNGDGFDDLLVANWRTDRVHLFLGGASGIASGTTDDADTILSAESWSQLFGLAVDAGDFDGDGFSDVVVAGSDVGSVSGGAAYVFAGSAGGIPDQSGASATTRIGQDPVYRVIGRVGSAGDVDGDGDDDLLVGASDQGAGSPPWEGSVHLLLGRTGGIPSNSLSGADMSFESNQASAGLGTGNGDTVSVAAGDLDGDGASDVLVGAPGWDADQTDEGGIFVFHGARPVCDNGLDDDGDTAIDFPGDPGCESAADDSETGDCENGLDDDGDGRIDVADPGCSGPSDSSERSETLVCDDGIDNDADGLVDDAEDPGCFDPTSVRENPACDDGLDNDGDDGIDWDGGATGTPDSICVGKPFLNREKPGCGLGTELALLLGALAARARREGRGSAPAQA